MRVTRLFALFPLIALLVPRLVQAAEPVPGTACTTANYVVTTGGPETGGARYFLRCNGSVWVQELTFSSANNYTGILTTTPAAPLHVNGEAIIGPSTTGIACNGTTTGGLRWDSADSTFQMCDGSSWKLLVATGGTGTQSSPNSGTGYFVLSNGTWNGNMGGRSGADALCLSDLQSNNWLNKTDAASRGLLDSSHVQAWLCDGSTCSNALASTTYTFAASGNTSVGGATFATDSSSQLPGNAQNWSGTNYFGSGVSYWVGRNTTSSTLAAATQDGNDHCYSTWGGTSGYGATIGTSNATDSTRWSSAGVSCTTSEHLICMVHPGNEHPAGNPGYLVMTSSSWDGNLGGFSGANSKCLTELTTYTNWLGYASANANGQLTSSKVYAFLCGNQTNTCNILSPSTTYNFAVVGSTAVGGASFTTDSNGIGPSDSQNWAGSSYFGGNYTWWSDRSYSSGTAWSNTSQNNGSGYNDASCQYNFSSNNASYSGMTGYTPTTTQSRWDNIGVSCSTPEHLVCFVNP